MGVCASSSARRNPSTTTTAELYAPPLKPDVNRYSHSLRPPSPQSPQPPYAPDGFDEALAAASAVNVNNFSSSLVHHKSQVSPAAVMDSFTQFGNKEDTFFDSQKYVDSDCDEDFYSVNGDFTPSRGSSLAGTPRSQSLSPKVNRAFFGVKPPPIYSGLSSTSLESVSIQRSISAAPSQGNGQHVALDDQTTALILPSTNSSSPTGKRKKLAELFRDSREIQFFDGLDFSNTANSSPSPSNSVSATPDISGPCSPASTGARTPTDDTSDNKAEKETKTVSSLQCCFPRSVSTRMMKKTILPPPTVAVDA